MSNNININNISSNVSSISSSTNTTNTVNQLGGGKISSKEDSTTSALEVEKKDKEAKKYCFRDVEN